MSVWSVPSGPMMASKTIAQSSTVLEIGPILSMDQLSAMAPVLLTRPGVGRRPVAPQRLEGETIEPQVSVPMAKATRPAAVAEALPADDPRQRCPDISQARKILNRPGSSARK